VNNTRFLFFIGSGRTGSTFLGQVLNYHPNCLISNESRFLDKVIKQKYSADLAFDHLRQEATKQFENGLENTGYNMSQYQGRWKEMGHLSELPEFNKKQILVIGDKKAGGTTSVFREHKQEFLDFVTKNKFYFLHLVRNPAVAARSYMKSHGYKTYEKACKKVLDDSILASTLEDYIDSDLYLRVYYEDLLDNFDITIENVNSWLGLETDPGWLSHIQKTLNKNDSETDMGDLNTAKEIVLTADTKNIFKRYFESI
tara:strand:- start:2977 stop:3744 length:768 start_codon:yes stop_codon:yes gene_type:complete